MGKSLGLFARGAELFTWSPALGLDNPMLSNPKATPQTTTTCMVIGRDNKSCFSHTAFVPVVVYTYPLVDACFKTVARPTTTTTYTITVLNKGNCESKDDVIINVICKDGNLFRANTFSPNGDGNNDVFYPRG